MMVSESKIRRLEVLPPMVLGAAACLISVLFLVLPDDFAQSSIAMQYPLTFCYLWLALFGTGGALTLWGGLRGIPQFEGAGLSLVSGAYLIDAIAIISARGVPGLLSGGLIAATGIASGFRALVLYLRFGP